MGSGRLQLAPKRFPLGGRLYQSLGVQHCQQLLAQLTGQGLLDGLHATGGWHHLLLRGVLYRRGEHQPAIHMSAWAGNSVWTTPNAKMSPLPVKFSAALPAFQAAREAICGVKAARISEKKIDFQSKLGENCHRSPWALGWTTCSKLHVFFSTPDFGLRALLYNQGTRTPALQGWSGCPAQLAGVFL